MAAGGQAVAQFDSAVAKFPAKLDLLGSLAPTLPVLESEQDEQPWAENDGASTDAEEEAAAHQSLRGQTALVTAACPRQYPREFAARRAQGLMIPDDFSKEES